MYGNIVCYLVLSFRFGRLGRARRKGKRIQITKCFFFGRKEAGIKFVSESKCIV